MRISTLVGFLCLASLTACTIQETSPSSSEAPAPSEEASAEGSPQAPAAGSASSVPGSIVGSWSWISQHGGQTLTFEVGGGYSNDVFLDAHPGESCGVEYFTHRKGTATFTENTLTLRSSESTRTKTDSCKGTTLATETIENQDETYGWRIDADDRGKDVLVLEREDTSTQYGRVAR